MFDFYNALNSLKRKKYDNMLGTHYILLMCDLALFQETDENGEDSLSASWVYSIQNTIEKFGFKPSSYPFGSISANRFYYEVLRNYLQESIFSNDDFNLIRKALINFLRLRRDDNKEINTKLFGSYFSLVNSHSRENYKTRSVSYNIRHSVTALWIICEESSNIDNEYFIESFKSVVNWVNEFISSKRVWNGEEFEHLTLSSTINTCNSILGKSGDVKLKELAENVKTKCEELFLSECLGQDMLGYYFLKLPADKPMSNYEFYLTYFSLTQVKHLFSEERIQSIIKRILSNSIECDYGTGIPVYNLEKYTNDEQIKPDFGTTASMTYLLYYIVDNELGDAAWIEFCRKKFTTLLDFCMNTYDKPEFYQLSISENNAKILLLPNYGLNNSTIKRLNTTIKSLKSVLRNETLNPKGSFQKSLSKIELEDSYEHLKSIIQIWDIDSKSSGSSFYYANDFRIKAGEFVGALLVGAAKTLSN
jgi:hypothetical protein